jgi:hypothetical protein
MARSSESGIYSINTLPGLALVPEGTELASNAKGEYGAWTLAGEPISKCDSLCLLELGWTVRFSRSRCQLPDNASQGQLVYDSTGAEDKMGRLADEVVFAGRASPSTPPVSLTSPRDLGPPITLRALW